MSQSHANSRARANHELYLAKIVLAAWRGAVEQQRIPATTLTQAFAVGVKGHLVAAYGWFLLTVAQLQVPQGGPPRGCEELPAVPEGKVLPGEINEFRQLEAGGWLGDMLRGGEVDIPMASQRDNLAVAAGDLPGIDSFERWLGALEALFERMSDSLDEC